MPDRYQSLVRTPVGHFLAGRLGLPVPPQLRRYRTGDPLIPGPVLVRGGGRLKAPIATAVGRLGGAVSTAAESGSRHHAVLLDATDIRDSGRLVGLQQEFAPILRSLHPSGRLVVLGCTPELTESRSEHIAQRALEGFTRSLAKESRGGTTGQLVYVAPGAEERLASTLEFLLSYRSAFVDGQVVRIDTTVAGTDGSTRPEQPLAGQLALVTGASRGIGAAIARTLHGYGATPVGVDVPQAADKLIQGMSELDGHHVVLDITAVDAPQRIARALKEISGGVDIVVHNAGITRDRRLANMDAERFGSVVAVNLTAPERITEELVDRALLRRRGRVVGIASIAGIAGNDGQTNYATSKAGVIGFVDAYAPLLASHAITVNAVAPGFIETEMTDRIPVLIRQAGRRMSSLGQGGLPVDVAETIAWLVHPGSIGVTGNVVRVCGQSLLGA